MKIAIEIPEHVFDDWQRTGFKTRDQRGDVDFLRVLVAFLIVENARDLATAMRFSAHLAQRREAKTLGQTKSFARNYHSNEMTKGAA
jgi:hypothetical protein